MGRRIFSHFCLRRDKTYGLLWTPACVLGCPWAACVCVCTCTVCACLCICKCVRGYHESVSEYMCVCTGACVWTYWCKCGLLHSVFWASKPAVAMALPSHLSRPQNPDVPAGPLSRQSSGDYPRLLPQTSTADDSSLPPSVVQVLAGAPRVGAGRRWARSVGESIEGGKRNKRVGGE